MLHVCSCDLFVRGIDGWIKVDKAVGLLMQMKDMGVSRDIFTYNAALHGYVELHAVAVSINICSVAAFLRLAREWLGVSGFRAQ